MPPCFPFQSVSALDSVLDASLFFSTNFTSYLLSFYLGHSSGESKLTILQTVIITKRSFEFQIFPSVRTPSSIAGKCYPVQRSIIAAFDIFRLQFFHLFVKLKIGWFHSACCYNLFYPSKHLGQFSKRWLFCFFCSFFSPSPALRFSWLAKW